MADIKPAFDFSSGQAEDSGSEREVLFRLDGVEYTWPKRFSAKDLLLWNDTLTTLGQTAAINEAMKIAIGEQAWRLLLRSNAASEENLWSLAAVVLERLTGHKFSREQLEVGLPVPKAPTKSPKRSSKTA